MNSHEIKSLEELFHFMTMILDQIWTRYTSGQLSVKTIKKRPNNCIGPNSAIFRINPRKSLKIRSLGMSFSSQFFDLNK